MGPTALTALQALAERFEVLGVVRNENAAPGQIDDVASLAQRLGIPVFTDPAPAAVEGLVRRLRPDCVVISSYNRILDAGLIGAVPFINVHYAPLPRYRGRATVNWALINGESSCAISIHVVSPHLDSGNILFQHSIPIGDDDDVQTLYSRLNEIQRAHLAEAVIGFLNGDPGTPQQERDATYACTRLPDDGIIDWHEPTQRIARLVRALTDPYPGAYTWFLGRRLTVWKAIPRPDAPTFSGRIPGRVVGVSRRDGSVDVLTGDGILRLLDVTLQGERRTTASEVIGSVRATLGTSVPDLMARIERLEQALDAAGTTRGDMARGD